MTRRERLENKLEKRLDWAISRGQKSIQAFNKSDLSEGKSGIPFGQPILVGHHSEGRHRRAVENAQNAMRQSIEHSDMAQHHEQKAEGIQRQLDTSIFSDDPDAIEALQEKLERLEAERDMNTAINKIVRQKPKDILTPEKIQALVALGIKETTTAKLFEPDFCGRIGLPSYVNQNLSGRIKATKDRLEQVKTQQERKQKAESSGGVAFEYIREYVRVTFAEKPEYSIIKALKDAGFYWGSGSWTGKKDDLPQILTSV